ncbi:arginine--tRNA ligase, partial [candidate division KSB1 bacterium]
IGKFYQIEIDESQVKFELPPNPEYGDLGIGCFFLAKVLKKSPAVIAKELSEANLDISYIKSWNPVGPYLNINIEITEFFKKLYQDVIEAGSNFGCAPGKSDKKVMIEYSAPNTNKPQHLGHIRNNVLGVAISNLLDTAGENVVKVNLVNDRGIHICKSMYAYDKWGEGQTPETSGKKGDHFVGDFYVMFEKKVKEDPGLLEKAQDMLQKWEDGDKEVVSLWQKMNNWVYDGFDETYKRLGCEFDKIYYESETYKYGREIVLKGLEEGKLLKNKNGDIVVQLPEFDTTEKVLLRKDGTSIYITQDLGTTVGKFTDFDLDRSIFVVASEQNLHFKILFHVLKLLGYEWADRCYHLNYGMVYLPEGKMKSREGKVVDADNLMDELYEMAKQEVLKRTREMDEEELNNVSESVALSALKYFILKIHPQKDIHFSPEDSLSFEGATGPFAQYSYARLSSILRKGKDKLKGKPDPAYLGNTEETKLLVLLAQYPDIIADSAASLNPTRLTSWIFDVSKAINKFHHDHSVLKADSKELMIARGTLIKTARQILGNALRVLGISPLERM